MGDFMQQILPFKILFYILYFFFFSSCDKNILISKDYRNFPVAVDCNSPKDVNLTYEKKGMPKKKVDETNVDFKMINGDFGKMRPVCIFQDLTLLEICQYKGADFVAPYWVADYERINAVKCKEVLKK